MVYITGVKLLPEEVGLMKYSIMPTSEREKEVDIRKLAFILLGCVRGGKCFCRTSFHVVMGTAPAQSPKPHEPSPRLAEPGQAFCQAWGGSRPGSGGCRPRAGREAPASALKAAEHLLDSFSAQMSLKIVDNQYISYPCHPPLCR
jgi:hypothetical protein